MAFLEEVLADLFNIWHSLAVAFEKDERESGTYFAFSKCLLRRGAWGSWGHFS